MFGELGFTFIRKKYSSIDELLADFVEGDRTVICRIFSNHTRKEPHSIHLHWNQGGQVLGFAHELPSMFTTVQVNGDMEVRAEIDGYNGIVVKRIR